MTKRLIRLLINKMGLRAFVNTLRTLRTKRSHERQIRLWIKHCQQRGALVDSSVEIDGRLPSEYITLGSGTHLQKDVNIWLAPEEIAHPRLTVGTDTFIGRNTFLGVYDPITIGSYVQIAAYCYIVSQNHGYSRRDIPIKHQDFVGQPITIEDDVWLGTHVVVLPGVTIGKGAIVAAGSVVNKSIPPYEIWGGSPAKFLKTRPD